MNAKKILALLLALVMVFALAVSCKGKTEKTPDADTDVDAGSDTDTNTEEEVYDGTQVPEEFVTLYFYYPGEYGARFEEYMNNEYAELIKADLNCAIDMQFCGWGDYWTKEETILASGQTLDFYWDGLTDVSKRVANGYNMPIDELVEKYGYGIKKVMSDEHINTGKVNGKLYGIPGTCAPLALSYYLGIIRTDIMDAAGITEYPVTPAEFQEFYQAAYDLGYKGPAASPSVSYARYHAYELDPENMWTPVGSANVTAVVESTGKMINKFATDAYLETFKDCRSDFEKGFIDEDLLIQRDATDPRLQSGQFSYWSGASIGKDNEIIATTRNNDPAASFAVYNNVPDAPKYKSLSSGECLQIPHSSENPERVVMWWSWLYGNKDNYYATIYGVDGTDYEIVDGALNRFTTEDFFYEWMFRIGEYMVFDAGTSQEYIDEFVHFDDDCIYSKVFGFYFDTKATDELSVAMTQLKTVLDENTLGLGMTGGDVEEDYQAFLADLEAAGAQVEIDECQRQYDEWANA